MWRDGDGEDSLVGKSDTIELSDADILRISLWFNQEQIAVQYNMTLYARWPYLQGDIPY